MESVGYELVEAGIIQMYKVQVVAERHMVGIESHPHLNKESEVHMIGALITLICFTGIGYIIGYGIGRSKGYDEGYNFSERTYQRILETNHKVMGMIRDSRGNKFI